ncbi:hypothetical protein OSB04_004794 [Centaurea solstitialis]|uniref:Uncharacterized protein n=1 Tax=Centaurea solstitialis TaxID=347529 RepID=A0AA38TET0_9ASTR|nr:hypothetical protein OSB04_004794 [Centaurea solstitialis]
MSLYHDDVDDDQSRNFNSQNVVELGLSKPCNFGDDDDDDRIKDDDDDDNLMRFSPLREDELKEKLALIPQNLRREFDRWIRIVNQFVFILIDLDIHGTCKLSTDVNAEKQKYLSLMEEKFGLDPLTSMTRNFDYTASTSGSQALELQFLHGISTPIFTGMNIKGEEDKPFIVALVDGTGKIVNTGVRAAVTVEIVVLEGGCNDVEAKNWSSDEFNKKIVRQWNGTKVLQGNTFLNLKDGIGYVDKISFTHNKTWKKKRNLRLGARSGNAVFVKEAKTESFLVSDKRDRLYKNHSIPDLHDDVWRLHMIGKNGPLTKNLAREKIKTIFHRAKQGKNLKKSVEHALTCPTILRYPSSYQHEPEEDAKKLVISAFENWGDVTYVDEDQFVADCSNPSVYGLAKTEMVTPCFNTLVTTYDKNIRLVGIDLHINEVSLFGNMLFDEQNPNPDLLPESLRKQYHDTYERRTRKKEVRILKTKSPAPTVTSSKDVYAHKRRVRKTTNLLFGVETPPAVGTYSFRLVGRALGPLADMPTLHKVKLGRPFVQFGQLANWGHRSMRKINEEQQKFLFLMVKKYGLNILKGMTGNFDCTASTSGSQALQLQFSNGISTPVSTGMDIKGEDDKPFMVALVDGTGEIVKTGAAAAAKVEIVVLEGDCSDDEAKNWSSDKFNNKIVPDWNGTKVLQGNVVLNLKEGVGYVDKISFTHNKDWKEKRECRLGARFVDAVLAKEAKTESFIVVDKRNLLYCKHPTPSSSDELWRLDKISRRSVRFKRISNLTILQTKHGIGMDLKSKSSQIHSIPANQTVSNEKCEILDVSPKKWEDITEHAQRCKDDKGIYLYHHPRDSQKSNGVVFNIFGQLVGLIAESQFIPSDKLPGDKKADAQELVVSSSEHWKEVIPFTDQASLMNHLQITSNSLRLGLSVVIPQTTDTHDPATLTSPQVIKPISTTDIQGYDDLSFDGRTQSPKRSASEPAVSNSPKKPRDDYPWISPSAPSVGTSRMTYMNVTETLQEPNDLEHDPDDIMKYLNLNPFDTWKMVWYVVGWISVISKVRKRRMTFCRQLSNCLVDAE